MMRIWIVLVLGLGFWSCSGVPVYDYDPSTLREALHASVAQVNSQVVLSPYLFRAFRSSIKRAVHLCGADSLILQHPGTPEMLTLVGSLRETPCLLSPKMGDTLGVKVNLLDEENLSMDIEFSIRETECRRDSGEDPSTCNFQRSHHLPTALCRSSVQVSDYEVQDVQVHCHWVSISESDSSEEMIFKDMLRSYTWRNSYLQGLGLEEARNGQFYERSSEPRSRLVHPAPRRHPAHQYRARTYTGFEE